MSEKERKILENVKDVLPKLNELEKERFLGFGEGLAYAAGQREENNEQ